MLNEQLIDQVIGITILFNLCLGLFLGMAWAAEREAELGISGMSSERILVRAELNENK
jgi:hypothetical protein